MPINISGDGLHVLGQHLDGGPFNVYTSVPDYDEFGEHDHLEEIISDLAGIDLEEIDYVDAHGISRGWEDGLFISGEISLDGDAYAFVFGGSDEPELRILANYDEQTLRAAAFDVSDGGFSAVGEDFIEPDRRDLVTGLYRALWWTDTTDEKLAPILLHPLIDDDGAWANAMDGAGTRAVGASYFDDDGEEATQAVYWNLSGDAPQAVSLGSLTSFGESEALDISRNGRYIVGWADTEDGEAPFISYSGGAMSRIFSPHSAFTRFGEALGVSNDGRAVGHFHLDIGVGERSLPLLETIAFIHSPAWGSKTINQWLTDSGVEVSEDLHYLEANAISEDGKTVVGTALYLGGPVESTAASDGDAAAPRYEAIFADGFIAREGSGSINPSSYQNNLGMAGGALQQAFNSINMAMHGSHHIPLQMMKGPARHAWFTADAGRWDNHHTNSYLAEAGFAFDLMDQQLLVGFGVGENYVEQQLLLGGDTDIQGQYYLTELSFKPKELPLVFTLTGALGSWDADVNRNYLNAGNIDSSSGSPHLNSAALRFSVHWLDAVKLAGWGFTPKLEYTVNQMTIGGYAEQGGGFPAFFNEQNHTVQELRYGFSAARGFAADKGLLRLRAEGVHRFDQSGPVTSGNVIGLFGFNLPGQSIQQDWVQFGGDVVYSLTQRTNLTFGVSTATTGEDPVIGGSVGVQVKF